MSKERFEQALSEERLSKNRKIWFPRWLGRYAAFVKCTGDSLIPIEREQVIRFLRMLRDKGVPAWQRLQAVEAIECYQSIVRRDERAPLKDVRLKLTELAQRERNSGVSSASELDIGQIKTNEPVVLQETRKALRRMHYSQRTERAYTGWIQRFLSVHDGQEISDLGENEIKEFLSELATEADVAASTQNQALSALLFLFQKVLGKQLQFMEYVRAERAERLPVVLSLEEIQRLAAQFSGTMLLIFQLLYGAGLRHLECLRLRIKDVAFDQWLLVVRDGKGEKDRVTVLPDVARAALQSQIATAKRLHAEDLDRGFGRVQLPYALARKYPHADRETAWQFVFPAERLSRDPRSGIVRRHHMHDSTFAKAMKVALKRAGIEKNATPHTLRQVRSFYNISLRMDYLKGISVCLGSTPGSWRPVLTASTAA